MNDTRAPLALVLGSVTRDFIRGQSGTRPGGVVVHGGIAHARLGARVRVVTRVRAEDASDLLAPLEAEAVQVLPLPSAATTTYVLDYTGAVDVHELVAASDPITPDDVPLDWRRANCVHLGPLHRGDLAPGLAASLDGMVGLDVQGLLRESGPEGTRLRPNPELPLHLDGVHVVQVSASELRALIGGESGTALEFARRYGVPELIVTRGRRGATVIADGAEVDVEPEPANGANTVGAGDTFLAAYLEARVLTRCSPANAARAAGRVTAQKIEHGGVPKGIDLEKLCG